MGEKQNQPLQLSFNASFAAEEIRPLVAHQLAAAAGEGRRAVYQTLAPLLAALGRESSDKAALGKHAVQDRWTAITSGVAELPTGSDFSDESARQGKVSEESPEREAVSGLGILWIGKTGPFRGPWKHLAPKPRLEPRQAI
jgi:hypothetical protein